MLRLRQREHLVSGIVKRDEILREKLPQRVDDLILGQFQELRDVAMAPEARPLGTSDKEKEEVKQSLFMAQFPEDSTVEDSAINPGEAPGDGAYSLGLNRFSESLEITHRQYSKNCAKVFSCGHTALQLERCLSFWDALASRGGKARVHIGIHTRWEILEDKLEQREDRRRTTATWQITRLPEKLSKEGPNHLFVAVDGIWQGYFTLKDEILFNPEDSRCPYSLVFDTRSWVEIRPLKTKRFRGFTYNTPSPEEVVLRTSTAPEDRQEGGSTPSGRVGQNRPAGGSVSGRE
jgi:hypothetical protein